MGEQLGLLKVIVVQGKRLVIRDFKTSDPYVVLKLGNQVLQRKTEEAAMATKRLKELLEAHKSSSETLQVWFLFSTAYGHF
ncbi:protein C2-DOMAIN ABA-RELATED 11-like isoform X3 [Glycine soja]|uniref:protein C2-DOMAIN ABA-RELATED 11-like isoform X3 n=1 Tax=Glycine soja TaxID=3848 RepID=UPI00103D5B15|nr:protein C2-DOMAIN ABA-RELATED 11-like isoform X3 [Glycine soja]